MKKFILFLLLLVGGYIGYCKYNGQPLPSYDQLKSMLSWSSVTKTVSSLSFDSLPIDIKHPSSLWKNPSIKEFNNIPWDSPFIQYRSEFSEPQTDTDYPNVTRCMRLLDSQSFAGVTTNGIVYSFDENGFYDASFMITAAHAAQTNTLGVSNVASGADVKSSFNKLLDICSKRYLAAPREEKVKYSGGGYGLQYTWDSPLRLANYGRVRLVLIVDAMGNPIRTIFSTSSYGGVRRATARYSSNPPKKAGEERFIY